MKEAGLFVGIDVSQDRLDLAVRPTGETRQVVYNPAGTEAMTEYLKELGPQLVVVEATGGLEMAVAAEMAAAGLPVVVANPRKVRAFARATGRLAKTDALDAQALAHYGETLRPQPRALPDAATRELKALVVRRRQLVEMITAERNRLRMATRRVRPRVQEHINWLKENLAELDQDLDDTIRSSPIWKDQDRLLRSVPGVGPVLSLTLLSGLPEFGSVEPGGDRRGGGGGAFQPGQRQLPRETTGMGRTQLNPRRPLHGGPGGHQVQPSDKGLLPAPVQRGQAQEGGPHRVYAQAVDHPERHGPGTTAPGPPPRPTLNPQNP